MILSAISEVRKAAPYLDAGYKAIDVSFCGTIYDGEMHDPILDGDDWLEKINALKAQFDQQGIKVTSTHLPYRYDFADLEAPDYAANYEMTRRSLIASELLGAQWTVVHVSTAEATVAHVKKLLADTQVKNIGIAIENMIRLPMENVIEAHDILKAEGYNVGICFDFGHCHINVSNNYDVAEMIYRLGDRIKMLHIHDNCRNGDQHRVPYAGTIPWRKCMQALKDIGFTGDFNYELNLKAVPEALVPSYVKYSMDVAQFLIAAYNEHIPTNKEETK